MKIIQLVWLLIFASSYFLFSEKLVAEDEPKSIEETYEMLGYTAMDEAREQFEQRFTTRIDLPETIPFSVAHTFGKVEEALSRVLLEFLDPSGDNHLTVIASLAHFKHPEDNHELTDGTRVYIHRESNPNTPTLLFLEKDPFEYGLSLHYKDERLEKEKIIEIAESLNEQ